MRELILKRIKEIKDREMGFKKALQKWNNFSISSISTGTVNTHISEMDFSTMDDVELLMLFERIVKRYNAQY